MRLRLLVFSIFVFGIFLASSGLDQQSAEELYQAGLYKEEVNGDLQGAIALYKQIIAKYGDNRVIAAKAQLHIGFCYEKLGLKEAPKAYQKVIEDFPEQKESVIVAQEKLKLIQRMQRAAEVSARGLNLNKVWDGLDTDATGTPSPDGRYLSFVDWSNGNLGVRDLKTGKKRMLTKQGSFFKSVQFSLQSVWSPDSRSVAYTWQTISSADLRIVGLDNAKSRILFQQQDIAYIEPLDWSSDGELILVLVQRKKASFEQFDIGLISVKDGSFKMLDIASDRVGDIFGRFAFSPGREYIAYSSKSNQNSAFQDVSIFSTSKNREIAVIEFPAIDFVLDWSPDGKYVLFASNRTGTFDIWVQGIADGRPVGKPELIKRNIGPIIPLGFARDASFYYCLNRGAIDIYIASLDFDKGVLLKPPLKATKRFIGSNNRPAFSPDGKYLSYFSNRSLGTGRFSSLVLCIQALDTGKEREIATDLNSVGRGTWSPDGRFLLVDAKDKEDHKGIYLINVQTGETNSIIQVNPGINLRFTTWSKDGKKIFYNHLNRRTRIYRILMYDLEKKTEKELYQWKNADPRFLTLSPDGSTLAFSLITWAPVTQTLNAISVSGGEPQELLRIESRIKETIHGGLAWTIDGKGLLFAKADVSNKNAREIKSELWMLSLEERKSRFMGVETTRIGGLSLHPDGRQVAFKSGSRTLEIWVMENLLSKEKSR